MKNFLIIVIAIVICSCSAAKKQHRKEQRLARLIKENPQLAKTDTIYKDTSFIAPAFHDSLDIELTESIKSTDSLTDHFKNRIDSNDLDTLNKRFKAILNKSEDIDTIISTNKSTVHIKKHGSNLKVDIESKPDTIKAKIPIQITNINIPTVDLKWYEKIFRFIEKEIGVMGFSLLLLLIFYISYRIIKKEFFN